MALALHHCNIPLLPGCFACVHTDEGQHPHNLAWQAHMMKHNKAKTLDRNFNFFLGTNNWSNITHRSAVPAIGQTAYLTALQMIRAVHL